MASRSLPLVFTTSALQCARRTSSSADSFSIDDVKRVQVQHLLTEEIRSCNQNKISSSFDDPKSVIYSSIYKDPPYQRNKDSTDYAGYLQHQESKCMSWKRKYFHLTENKFLCFTTPNDPTSVFEIEFTRNSVLVKNERSRENTLTPQWSGINYSSQPNHLLSLHQPSSCFESMTFLLQFVVIREHKTSAPSSDTSVVLRTETPSDYVAWTKCLNDVIQARKRALLQDTNEKRLSDKGRDETSLPFQPQPSESTMSDDSMKRRISNLNGLEKITKMSHQIHGDSATIEKSKSLVTVETYDAFSSRYLLMKEIGEGSFSIVHRAVNRMTGHMCAVKCCKVSRALEEEERLLRTLSHPNIVSLEGVFERNKNFHYVVMDYLKDGDMCDQLIERQRLPEPEARRIIRQVVEGLAYLHRRCVLHRDIKLENILLHGNMVKIADFGLAKELEKPTTLLKHSCGTLEYAAPELLCSQPYGLKSDVFSLGIVLYVLLFGAFPFSVESAAALQCMDHFPKGVDVRDMRCLRSSNVQWRIVSPLAQDALLKMLKTNHTERISAEDLLDHPWFTETVAGMSESISSIPKDLELSRIEDCETMGFAELLSRGFRVVKYGCKELTTPYVTSLSLNFMEECINWTAPANLMPTQMVKNSSENTIGCHTGQDHAIFLRDIQDIREGHTTKAFLSYRNKKSIPPPELCLSIICPWRTLNIVVEAPSQRAFMVRGFRRLITLDA